MAGPEFPNMQRQGVSVVYMYIQDLEVTQMAKVRITNTTQHKAKKGKETLMYMYIVHGIYMYM